MVWTQPCRRARAFAKDDPDNSLYDLISGELYEKAGTCEGRSSCVREGGCGAALGRPPHGLPSPVSIREPGDLKKAEGRPDPTAWRRTRIILPHGQFLGRLYLNIAGETDDARKTYEALLASRADRRRRPSRPRGKSPVAEKKWVEATDYIKPRSRRCTQRPGGRAHAGQYVRAAAGLEARRTGRCGGSSSSSRLTSKFSTRQGRVQIAAGRCGRCAFQTYRRAHELAPAFQPDPIALPSHC